MRPNFFINAIFFRVNNIFQKYKNLKFFVIYFCKINIMPSAWDH